MKFFKLINTKILTGLAVIAIATGSCKKFIEVESPSDRVTESSVFNDDATATSVLTGIYSTIAVSGLFVPDVLSISKLTGFSADELNLWTGAEDLEKAYYTNALYSNLGPGGTSNAGVEIWNVSYSYIFKCNQAIIGITNSKSISPTIRKQLLGEAKFLRAFLYFYLVNLYGDIPFVNGVDPKINRSLPRKLKSEVYNSIIDDLKEAQSLLSSEFLQSNLKSNTTERVRPTKWAATALLARVYLYIGEFLKAESEATDIIEYTTLFDVSNVALENVFLKNSTEAIWQIQPGEIGYNTLDARWSVLADDPVGFSNPKSAFLSSSLYSAFEAGDDRKVKWVGTYVDIFSIDTFKFPYKYKLATPDPFVVDANSMKEYHMILRVAEQYLIRAEARAMEGNISGAVSDLNLLRRRARATPTMDVPNPLPDISSSITQAEAIEAVIQERRTELFVEWGHRWLDLRRTGKLDSVMSIVAPQKGGTWQPTDAYYPIPIADIQQNSNLTQNIGY